MHENRTNSTATITTTTKTDGDLVNNNSSNIINNSNASSIIASGASIPVTATTFSPLLVPASQDAQTISITATTKVV